jgi:ribonuclease BN (tRNA processing enzyme)
MAPLTLTILGAGPAAPNTGGACSGYLLQEDGAAVLMDCGSGVAGRLSQFTPPNQLRGVAISHLHPDHYFDLVPLYYVLKFGEPRPTELGERVPLHLPPGGRDFMHRLGQLISTRQNMLEDVFDVHEYAADQETDIGGFPFLFHRVQHYVLSHAMRVRSTSGATLVFSSDVAPCTPLVEAAHKADLFMCESALVDPREDEPDASRRGHMSASEAGAAAREAKAKQLMLTHYRSSAELDDHHRERASQSFGDPVDLAKEGRSYTISR